MKSSAVERVPFVVPGAVVVGLRAFCRGASVSSRAALLAAFQAVLSRWSGAQEVIVGAATESRIVAVRASFEDTSTSFLDVVRQVEGGLAAASAGERDAVSTFNVLFAFDGLSAEGSTAHDGVASPQGPALDLGSCDLALELVESSDGLTGSLAYDVTLFDRATVERTAEHLGVFLAAATHAPEELVAKLPLMSAAERQRVVVDWNATTTAFGGERGLAQIFEEQVALTPDSIAIEHGTSTLTYRQVDRRANQLAHRLRRVGVVRGSLVAIFVERTPEMVVAMLAIVKAGGAYVPLDPSYPAERLAMMLEDSAAQVVLGESSLLASLLGTDPRALSLDDRAVFDDEPDTAPTPLAWGADLAYVMFTSGSTGRPKGACITQRAVARLVRNTNYVSLGPNHRVAQASNASFDAATFEIWGALLNGARLVILDKDVVIDPERLADAIESRKITTLFVTTALFNQIAELRPDAFRGLHDLMFGGEQVNLGSVRRVLPHKPQRLLHVYGPTETTTFATWLLVDDVPASATTIAIGHPISNTTVYVLDDELEPVPIGLPGELYIGGAGNAVGYWRRPDLTALKFIPNPYGPPGSTLYRTGDLGRRLADGSVEFVGRIDHQVKMRGYRIELGEVEAALTALHAVREVVVVAREDAPGDKRLVAYVVGTAGVEVEVDGLKAELARSLPPYMVPTAFVVLDAMPLTPNGKVNRKALPAPDFAAAAAEYAAPRDAVEEILSEVFRQVLRVARVGVHDDFFALGGHSLLATQVVLRVRAALGLDLPVRAIFESATVARLAERARTPSMSSSAAVAIARVDRSRPVPASFAQTRLWFLDQLEGGGATYNVPIVVRLEGAVDAAIMGRVVQALVDRHEALRTTFVAIDGEPHQVVHSTFEAQLSRVDVATEDEARAAVARQVHAPFDLANGPLLRATLVRLHENANILVVCIHHIGTDGWSTGILVRELSTLYGAFAEGKPSPLPAQAVEYADFAVWQRSWLRGDVLDRQLAFWREQLAGAPAALELPTDRPRPAIKQHHGDTLAFALTADVAAGVRGLCRREGATPFMVLLAAYQAVLARWSGQRDVVVGTAIANRMSPELEPVVGFFVNTLVMRTTFEAEASFVDVVRRVKRSALAAYAHQDVPFEKLVEELKVIRDVSRTPLVQAFFVMQNTESEPVALANLAVKEESAGLAVAKFDVTLAITEGAAGFLGTLEYDTALFDRATMERFVEHLGVFLDGALRAPHERVATIELLSKEERARLLESSNAKAGDSGCDTCVHELFENQAQRTPHAIALVLEEQRLTYRELDERANQLAHLLRARGVGPEVAVAFCLERTIDPVVAILGILKAGGAYVPIDPMYPPERRAFIIEDSGAQLVLTTRALAAELAAAQPDAAAVTIPTLLFDDGASRESLSAQPRTSPRAGASPSNLAYVIYTSGSTGQPKGSAIPHSNVVRLMRETQGWYQFGPDDCWTVFHSFAFDFSVWEIWGPLLYGGRAVVVPYLTSRSPSDFLALLEREGVTVLNQTPSAFRLLMEEATAKPKVPDLALRWVIFGGEALDIPGLRPWFERFGDRRPRLVNMYGITETTVHVTYREVSKADTERRASVIGVPIPDLSLYVLDGEMRLAPLGVVGELYVGGAGSSRCYLRRPTLTAERFVPDPFSPRRGARLYRTGDLARRLANGDLEYLGRADFQVKIRGFRVELGEIESVLARVRGVRDVVVLAREDVPGDKRLVAYMTADGASERPTVELLRQQLSVDLPDYMIPSAFVAIEALPLTANGKVDRNALPAPDFAAAAAAYVAPRDGVEEILADVFCQVLRVERVGVHDDFFALGGHSLLATQVVSRIRSAMGIELPVRAIFEGATVARLAQRARETSGSTSAVAPIARIDRSRPVAASFAQTRLWFLDQLEGGGATYNVPIVVRLTGPVDASVLERVLQALVERHETLRTTFVAIDGAPHQVIHPSLEVRLSRVDGASEDEARAAVAREVHAPFDLATGPLLRATLVRVREDAHVLVLTIHHIATDGWSSGILLRELSTLYGAFTGGKPSPLPALAVDYADFAVWQRAWLVGDVLAAQLAFWKEHLAGAPAALEVPTDRPRPAIKQHHGDTIAFVVPAAVAEGVRALCRREGATPFMVLLAAYQAVLARWSGQRDVVVGTAIANRMRQELEPVVGFFVNTLTMRTTFEAEASFVDVVRRVKHSALAAYAHQDVPFEKLVEELKVVRDLSRTPVFQAFFVMQNTESAPVALANLAVHEESAGLEVAKFDISLGFVETADGFHGSLEYDTALFDRATMERFVEHLGVFLAAATRAPTERVATLPLMSEAERQRVVVEWNATEHPLGDERTVHGLIAAQTDRTPAAVAVEFEGLRLTYRELEERANRVAHWLLERGVALEDRVAVEVERSHDMLSAVLGVMKAGGAYVPVDAKLPEDRKRFMKEDAGAKLVLDDATLVEALAHADSSRPAVAVRPDHLAYVLYTSGSTGRPKGVMVEHASVANLLASLAYEPGTGPDETTLSLTTLSFDVSVAELFLPLAFGAKVVVGSREAARDPKLIKAIIEATGARTFGATPTTWRMMVEAGWRPTAKMEIHCAGEALPRDLADALVEGGAKLWNLYGPTETTVYASGVEVGRGRITIGRPLRNTQLYVVDEHMQPVPIGVAGELCIAGAGVARGYLGRPELTAEKFVHDPFAGRPEARMYRTGDLARWLPSGEVDYLGRLDHQVKIRGFRIELGEIEAVLTALHGVREVVVLAREDAPGDKRLVAYVVAATGATLAVDALRVELARSLPDYMVPSAFVVLDALPMTTSGKVDRNALPAPDFAAAAAEYVAPRDGVEEILADVFRQVLRLERVGVHDDFFALGGHSLLAMQAVSRIRAAMGIELPVRAIFEGATVARLAQRARETSGARIREPELVRVPRKNHRLPIASLQLRLWFLEKLEPGSTAYILPTGERLRGELRVDALERAFAEIVRRHEALRTTFEEQGGEILQVIHDCPPLPWQHVDLSDVPAEEKAIAIDQQAQRERKTPFDLERGPLIRARLVKVAEDDHVLLVTMHHIVTDGWSQGVFSRELATLYAAFATGAVSPLPELTIQYGDYAVWQNDQLRTGHAAQLAFWKAQLAGAPSALELATSRPRPPVQRHRGALVAGSIGAPTTARLRELGRRHGATLYMTLLTAFTTLLGRMSGERDVVVATPIVNRTRPETEAMIGFFMNTIAVRVDTSGEPTFEELLGRARAASLDAYANQDVPFDRVVQELNPVRDMSRNPIAQVSLNVLSLPDTRIRLPGLEREALAEAVEGSKFDLTLYVGDHEALALHLVYDPDLFDEERMTRLLRRFEVVVDQMALDARTRIDEVSLVLEDERAGLPDPTARLPRRDHRPISSRFDAHAGAFPDRPAVADARGAWSYRELHARANRLAHWLRARKIGAGDVVAIHGERNALTVWALLAVMKSGAAFTMLDADHPGARLAEQVRIAQPKAWIEARESLSHVPELEPALEAVSHRFDLSSPLDALQALPSASPSVAELGPALCAYVVFTSGTTGGPRAIAGAHGPLWHFVEWQASRFGLSSADRFSVLSGIAHDPFLRDVLTPLSIGASVHVSPADVRMEPDRLAAWLVEHRITVCHLTPSLGELLALSRGAVLRDLRWMFFGGEPLRGELVEALRKVAPAARFANFYGATETPQAMTYHVVDEPIAGPVPIGRAIDDEVQALVLNDSRGIACIDEEGEICLRTPHLAIGYLEGTAGGFGVNPFTSDPADRIFRTGDRGRYLPDGTIQAHGRRDDQVKVRGFRVELREIEDALRACSGVKQVAVIVREDGRALVAYVVGDVESSELARSLRARLPNYMVPSAIVVLASLPFTPNGKLDRRALPAPENRSVGDAASEDLPSDIELSIAEVWKDVLGVEVVGRHDDFFDLGGHSLNATLVASRLRELFQVDVTVRMLFDTSTVAALAERIEEAIFADASPEALEQAMSDLEGEGTPE